MKSNVLVSLLAVAAIAPAFAQVPTSTAKLEFEVASVKALGAQDRPSPPQIDLQRFGYKNTLFNLVFQAYRPRCAGECTFRGTPAWFDRDVFAIEAKIPDNIASSSRSEFMQGKAPQISQMLRTLLEDRFKLKAHWETQELPTYEIVVDKNGSKLTAGTQLAEKSPTGAFDGSQSRDGLLSFTLPNGSRRYTITRRNSSIEDFAALLMDFTDRPVLDHTDLKGNFDFKLQFDSDEPDTRKPSNMAALRATMQDQLPAMINAMREQLGLNLKATKSPMDILIIDHVEQPSEN